MRRFPHVLVCALTAWIVVAASGSASLFASRVPQAGVNSSAAVTAERALLNRYCVGCHNERTAVAGLRLDTIDVTNVSADAAVWEKVIRKLRLGAMPPPGRPRPTPEAYQALAASLEESLDRAAAAAPDPGRTAAMHRLNRVEYRNAIRDLLAIEIDGASFLPPDDADEQGFDNIAEVLSISPALFERYMGAARRISRLAVGQAQIGSVAQTYKIHGSVNQDERAGEELPFGSRGGTAFRYYFPVDGEYGVKVSLQKNYGDYIRGMGTAQPLDIRVDGARVKTFTVGGSARGKRSAASYEGASGQLGDPEWEDYVLRADEALEVRFPVRAGPRLIAVSLVRRHAQPEDVIQPAEAPFGRSIDARYDGNTAIEMVTLSGPHTIAGPGDTPARRQVFTCRPLRVSEEEGCARKIVSSLARRAFRRSVADREVETLLGFYRAGRGDGGFDVGIQFALERLLVDPEFLFRIERDPADASRSTVYRVSDVELASRLSFFLWSSIPDEELLTLAEQRRLSDSGVLEQQVRRMLADRRSRTLVDNFAAQWLELRSLQGITPDPVRYPEFDEGLRDAFRRETELFLESNVREDRSVANLLTADYTFVNERLARHYGLPGVYGERFRRVTVPTEQRGGLLGHASILSVTSYPNRTSPVLRGKWLLGNILGSPPPPPPPDVPTLPDKGEHGKPVTVRERLEHHRRNAVCAVCHSQIDPLGFALEHFDPIGRWRTTAEGDNAIDDSGVLLDGTRFEGMNGLRAVLLSQREQFVGTVGKKLLTYALGRTLTHADGPAVRRILREAAADDYRWSSVIVNIVRSVPFQYRRSA